MKNGNLRLWIKSNEFHGFVPFWKHGKLKQLHSVIVCFDQMTKSRYDDSVLPNKMICTLCIAICLVQMNQSGYLNVRRWSKMCVFLDIHWLFKHHFNPKCKQTAVECVCVRACVFMMHEWINIICSWIESELFADIAFVSFIHLANEMKLR